MDSKPFSWHKAERVADNLRRSWVCGYCGDKVGSNYGYIVTTLDACCLICPTCSRPSLFIKDLGPFPQPMAGSAVVHLPKDVEGLYEEARRCISVAPTGCVLLCRKILMHVAVEKGGKEGARFIEYVEHLEDARHIPAGGKGWVDYVRTKGNEANHEILVMGRQEAEALLFLVEMLLRNIYELPKRIPAT
jgi:hypothetical protein